MINRIIDFSVKHKLLVLAGVAVACVFGWWAMMALPLDATPDLSETQVIIYSRWDRSPDIIEDQVTYPIVTAMTGAPKVKTVRGVSDFNYSYVYVIFEDGTDHYWARSRALEYLSSVQPRLPEGVKTEIDPDATAIGWVYQYALVDTSGKHSLADLRSYQDWYLRYYLRAVPGVAEVAPVGGYSRQYQVNVDPNRLQAYGIPIRRVVEAVRSAGDCSNSAVPSTWSAAAAMPPRSRNSRTSSSMPTPTARRSASRTSARWSKGLSCGAVWQDLDGKAKSFPASSSCAAAKTPWR